MEDLRKDTYHANFIKSLPKSYQKFSSVEKIKYWSETLNSSMRLQAEKGLDEYAVFSKDWYASFKNFDPDVDHILEQVFLIFDQNMWDWSKTEYLKRIS
jgi:hypothetical protein